MAHVHEHKHPRHRLPRACVFGIILLGLLTGSGAYAQDVAITLAPDDVPLALEEAPASGTDAASPAASNPPRITDVGDLWRHVRRRSAVAPIAEVGQATDRPFFFLSPSISSKPSTGLSIGVASSLVFVDGEPTTTRISSADLSMSGSVKGQAGMGMRFRVFTPDDRWFIQGDNRLAWTSLQTYDLGIVDDAEGEKLKFNRDRLYDTAFRQVKPHLFVGGGLNLNVHRDVRPGSGTTTAFADSAYASYSAQHGLALDAQTSSGTNVGAFLDTRNNPIDATRGWFAAATYRTFFKGFAGGSSTWQMLDVDARTYRSLGRSRRQTLALWLLGDFVTGGTAPFFDLPDIADDTYGRSARGYTTGRYRGPHLLYAEAEYRVSVSANGMLGAVAFVNATAVDGATPEQKLFATVAPASGGGLRVLLSKRSRTNLCLDYGWGIEGSRGLYLAVRETF